MTLYEINEAYLNAMENLEVNEDGEIVNFDDLDKLEGEFNDKAEAIALYIKDLAMLQNGVAEEIRTLQARKQAYEHKIDNLKEYLGYCMQTGGHTKIETPKCKLSFRASKSVNVTCEDIVPAEFKTTTTTVKIDKTAIKKAIADGILIPGAEVVESRKLQIR